MFEEFLVSSFNQWRGFKEVLQVMIRDLDLVEPDPWRDDDA